MSRLAAFVAAWATLGCAALAAGEWTPQQVDPATLPARDAHEGLLVAADPYHDAARAKARFGKRHPQGAGLLALEIFFRNDTDRPIRVELASIRLLLAPPGQSRQRLDPLPLEEVVERIVNKGRGVVEPNAPRYPLPRQGPQKRRSKEWQDVEATLASLVLEIDVLPPRSTVRGFVFFDLNRKFDWVPYARLYIRELKFLPDNQPLTYFEVDLAPAARP